MWVSLTKGPKFIHELLSLDTWVQITIQSYFCCALFLLFYTCRQLHTFLNLPECSCVKWDIICNNGICPVLNLPVGSEDKRGENKMKANISQYRVILVSLLQLTGTQVVLWQNVGFYIENPCHIVTCVFETGSEI